MPRRVTLIAAFAFAASLLVLVPALGNTVEDAVRLHLGTNGQNFSYGSTTQNLTVAKNGCQITSAEPLIHLSSTNSGTSSPGLAGYSMGVKSSGSNSNGTPCGQVDSLETLNIQPATGTGAVIAGRSFNKVRLDVEMTGDALASVKFFAGTTQVAQATLQTGTNIQTAQTQETGYDTVAPYEVTTDASDLLAGSLTDACAAPNSSGPNNAGNDNCLWTIDPGISFDKISITTSHGTVSLEGSGDFANNTTHDSLFYFGNGAPSAVNDSYSTNEDTILNASSANGVLSNDSDVNGDTFNAVLVTGPSNASSFTLNANGSFSYLPAVNFNGTDSFTYKANDGISDSNTATVTITVNAVNDPPVAVSGSESTPEDTAKTITVANDVDSAVINASCSTSNGGTWVNNGDGTVNYTPPLNFNGTDTLTCTVTDGSGASATSSSVINVGVTPVNDLPTAGNDTADTDEGTGVTITVLGNDDDGDPNVVQTLTVTNLSDPVNGTAVANADGTVTYTPDAGFVGTDTFTYKAFDGADYSNTATVTVTVFPVICTADTVEFQSPDNIVNGSITKINGEGEVVCKRYTLVAEDPSEGDGGTLLFDPSSASNTLVNYRAYLTFAPDPTPTISTGTNSFVGRLEYDPLGGTNVQPMQWCINPIFDGDGNVTSATLPGTETWCIASTATHGVSGNKVLTTWQVFGIDDPYIIKK